MTTAAELGQSPAPGRKLIAPVWHTALLVSIFLGFTVAGAVFQKAAQSDDTLLRQHPNMAPGYLSLMVAEWLLVYGVWAGIHDRGLTLRDLIGGKWASAREVFLDVALALGLWLAWIGVQLLAVRVMPSHAKSVAILFPQSAVEVVLWVLLSLTAGFSEEVAFRGYFQKQFQAMTGSPGLALVLQGVLFGITHGYQGVRSVVMITVFGLLYGLLALRRRSLRPGIITHAWSDIYAGYLAQFMGR